MSSWLWGRIAEYLVSRSVWESTLGSVNVSNSFPISALPATKAPELNRKIAASPHTKWYCVRSCLKFSLHQRNLPCMTCVGYNCLFLSFSYRNPCQSKSFWQTEIKAIVSVPTLDSHWNIVGMRTALMPWWIIIIILCSSFSLTVFVSSWYRADW